MRRLGLQVVVGAVFALAAATAAGAQQEASTPQQQPTRQRAMAGQGMNQRGGPFARLNLTEQQRTDIRNAMKASREAMAKDASELRDVRRQLHEALFADTPDQAQVAALSARLNQVQGNLQTARIQTQEQIATILTPDQRKLVRERGAGPMMGRMARTGRMGRMMR